MIAADAHAVAPTARCGFDMIDARRRGSHRVFLGMAAGVGKTYRMLQEGYSEAESGRDVVIGYLEAHGRSETEELARDLEVIPRRRLDYRGTPMEEMDLPAIFIATYATSRGGQGPLHVLNIMSLGSPRSAIVSAIIFNAIVIPLLIPLSLRGVRYRPIGASALLRRNLWIYGLGGIIAPFIGIKLIDLLVHNVLGA